jgi:aminoglycoside phosphotransferase (APT) family kinase protein
MNTEALQELAARLTRYLMEVSGESVTLLSAQPIAGGASRDTWHIEAQVGDTHERLILRRDQATVMIEASLTREQEFRLIDAAYQHGVRAPRPRWVCTDPAVLGFPFFIMNFVEGVSIGRKVIQSPELADARVKLPDQMAAQMALIHAIDPAMLDFLPRPRADHSPASEALQQAREMLDLLKIHNPAFEYALRWCEKRLPATSELFLLHGDFRIGNLLIAPDGLNGVIDWEFGHVGDIHEELAYPCMRDWRFGNGHLHFAGLSDRETFLKAYEHHSGRMVNRFAVDWWEIVGNLRWGVICLKQAARHLSGREVSVEYASLGRRSAEMQLEMLRLIQTAQTRADAHS